MTGKVLIACGAVLLALGVALGAISAHAAKNAAHPEAGRLLQTAVQYQLVHALGLVVIGAMMQSQATRWLAASGGLLLAGVVLFCGSLYLLAFTGRSLGPVPPVGGLALIAGWLALAAHAMR